MDLNEAREYLKTLQLKMSAYSHAQDLIYYDGMTSAPKDTADNRAVTLGVFAEESYRLSASEETVNTLEYLDANSEALTPEERRQIYLLLKDNRNLRKIPIGEYVAYQKLIVEAEDKWHTAKETNDFGLFEPYLEKIFETNIRFAGYIAPGKDPYDYLLGEFEEGLTTEVCDRFFGKLKEGLVPLIKKIGERPAVDDSLLYGEFGQDGQEKLSYYLMKLIGLDSGHVGLSTTEHPFTISLGSHRDERITTHYYEDSFVSSMYSVIHEGGHALYDTGSPEEFAYTVLDGGVSMGIHESQSRFYENIIGRSRAFCGYVFPELVKIFPSLGKYSANDFYLAVNKVTPSLIRTEADEVTYCLHVMIRYEIEKAVIGGRLAVRDIPSEWNRLYKEYLGIDVPDDTHGCLQDSHWSGGAIGYFPSYAVGSAYGAVFLSKMKETVDVDGCIAKGDFAPVNAWNKEKIWKYGCLRTPGRVFADAAGEEFDPRYYLEYLTAKMKDVYGEDL